MTSLITVPLEEKVSTRSVTINQPLNQQPKGYPYHLIRHLKLKTGDKLMIRPVHQQDGTVLQDFVRRLSPQSRYMRFMQVLQELTPSMLHHFTHIDYHSSMAYLAFAESQGEQQLVGVTRYAGLPNEGHAEFALAITDDFQGRGLGKTLMNLLIQRARHQGIQWMQADILANNYHMRQLMERLKFQLRHDPEDHGVILASRALSH